VIGVAPNLFYGTGIPACILVLRQQAQHGAKLVSGKPKERQGKVLFINADREYFEGRAQNQLLPEHIEKIVTTFDGFQQIDGFSAIVDNATLKAQDYNLNIRRYADNAPPPEPHDVRAHLVGGIPKTEVADKAKLFQAHGLDPMDLLIERDEKYYDFAPALTVRQDLKAAIETNPSLVARETALRDAFENWWQAHSQRIVELHGAKSSFKTRDELLTTFAAALLPVGMLDVFRVRGISAGFWYDNLNDFKAVMVRGPLGLIRGWRDTIISELDDEGQKKKAKPLEHKLVKFLMSDFVEAISELEARKAELDSQIKDASPKGVDDEEGDAAEIEMDADDENAVDEAQLKMWRKESAMVKKQLKAMMENFVAHLNKAVDGLSPDQAAELLLIILHNDMKGIVDRYVAAQRKAVIAAFESWWDKYRVTLTELENKRDTATKTLQVFLKGLQYV
jgi:type I restriction enzyme M protein